MQQQIFATREAPQTGAQTHGENPIVVKIRPGTAAEKSMRFVLPSQMRSSSIDQVVQYARGLKEEAGLTRESQRIQERIGIEMGDKYGLSINGQGVNGRESLADYLQNQTSPGGITYEEAEIIVAARQEGAYMLR
jgi:hypothetical protein